MLLFVPSKQETQDIKKEDDFLQQAYELIGTDAVDIVSLEPGLDIVVDDNGFLKGPTHVTKITGVHTGAEYTLAGNLLMVGMDEETGETIELTDEQKSKIFLDYEFVIGTSEGL